MIDAFISKNPKIKPVKKEGIIENIAEKRTEEPEQLMTETLGTYLFRTKKLRKSDSILHYFKFEISRKKWFICRPNQSNKAITRKNKNL